MQEIFIQKLQIFKKSIRLEQREENTAGILLFKFYITQLYEFYKKLDITDKWDFDVRTIHGHNLIELIRPGALTDFVDIEYFRTNLLNDTQLPKTRRWWDYIFIYYSVCWDIFKDDEDFREFSELGNPYESTSKIITRGNHIKRGEVGTIEVDHMPVIIDQKFNLPSLENDFLDYIDENCIRFATSGIPGQRKVDELWKNFNSK